MTKKSKKKAIKTGSKTTERSGLIVSVHLGLNVRTKGDVEDRQHSTLKKRSRRRRHNIETLEENDENRVSYPIDVWFHVSRHLAPEQVRAFSQICCACWKITYTSQFWLSLYLRFVNSFDSLPYRLQPDNIDCGQGLKSRIVRALYYVYPPLKITFKKDLTSEVINKKCVLLWWEKEYSAKRSSCIWKYFIKLVDAKKKVNTRQIDLNHNSEEHKMVIKIKCPNYIHLQQSVVGMILTSFNSCMSTDMRYHQLKMVFQYEGREKVSNRNEGTHMSINPVLDMNILPWWSPNYPYPAD